MKREKKEKRLEKVAYNNHSNILTLIQSGIDSNRCDLDCNNCDRYCGDNEEGSIDKGFIIDKLLDKETDMECAICSKPVAVGEKVYAELLVNEVFLVDLHDEHPSSLPIYHIDCLETFWFFNPDMKMVNQPINLIERSGI